MKKAKEYRFLKKASVLLLPFFIFICTAAFSEELDCHGCHKSLSRGMVVHQPVSMGCTTCHSAIDARKLPHKITNLRPKGLASKQPDSCFECHDKSKFTKKTTHDALVLGCTSCHNPHSSMDTSLLISRLPDLCFNCHEKDSVFGKNTKHPPVAGGTRCINCHNPHATDTPQLLITERFTETGS